LRITSLTILSAFISFTTFAQLPNVSSGSIKRFENFRSSYVAPRNIDVWLPEGYTASKKYAVIYMHDGQMLFDSSGNWAKQEWGVDETLGRLMKENKIKDCIVVGIWNSGLSRHQDYFPQKPFESIDKAKQDSLYKSKTAYGNIFPGPIQSDHYLQFIVKELKPFVDSVYSVKKDRANTFISGSSMGGLISMYAICEYPETFGGAACLSTHWPGVFTLEGNPIPDAFVHYMRRHLPDPKTHKIYFDYGDQTLDAMYPPLMPAVNAVMKVKGFSEANWETRFFPGENHSEQAWKKRFELPVMFLLKK
jgi:predicted alpha/beta superfamily hydrolase